jgi:signal transduction histidine kinase
MKKNHVVRKLVMIVASFMLVITALFILGLWQVRVQKKSNFYNLSRDNIVALNEIENLTQQNGESPAKEQIRHLQQIMYQQEQYDTSSVVGSLIVFYAISMAFLLIVFIYIYMVMIKPFHRMEKFAGELANGNLDVSLTYDRKQLFGAFTWAFDHMRREIIKARACEKEAVENNKTVIATLSHDIKTPIASIRTYTEALEANMDSSAERRQRYIQVIIKKCDEVTSLTNDLFLHSLSDLDKLKMHSEQIQIENVIMDMVREMNTDQNRIRVDENLPAAIVNADGGRFCQVLENIINNAGKYAKNVAIEVWAVKNESSGMYEVHIKDNGPGIAPEDMPFIFEKFYRGRNVVDEPGAGLGLYIVKYIMTQMEGEVQLANRLDGLEAILKLPYKQ